MPASAVPPEELDITTLRWVLGRLGTPDFIPTVPAMTQSNLPTWDPNLTVKVQINPALIPLAGGDPSRIADYLRLLAQQIEDGALWDVGVHCMGRGR